MLIFTCRGLQSSLNYVEQALGKNRRYLRCHGGSIHANQWIQAANEKQIEVPRWLSPFQGELHTLLPIYGLLLRSGARPPNDARICCAGGFPHADRRSLGITPVMQSAESCWDHGQASMIRMLHHPSKIMKPALFYITGIECLYIAVKDAWWILYPTHCILYVVHEQSWTESYLHTAILPFDLLKHCEMYNVSWSTACC